VVVVVDGVMSIQGDVSNVHKAKDHSHEFLGEEISRVSEGQIQYPEAELAREGEPDASKDACPVRERLH
jgi:hypothetical protein